MHLLTADDATLALSVHGINGSKKQLLQLYTTSRTQTPLEDSICRGGHSSLQFS